eukprot:Gb_09459 [translate_table: standard]
MARSRRKYKNSRPKVQVGLPRVKPHVFKPAFAVPEKLRAITSGKWDENSSVLQNYRSFGVVSNPNLLGAQCRSERVMESASLQKPPAPKQNEDECKNPEFEVIDSGSDLEEDDVKSALGKKRRDGKTAPLQRLTTMQRVYVSRLILKYGNDYQAMSRDIKLNAMQHPPAALEKLCKRFHAYEKL